MNITELLQALGILFVLMTGASTLGYFVLMPFPKFEHPYLKGAAEISLGFLIISELLLGFALGKALYPALFITLLTVLIVMSIFGIYRSARWVSRNEARFSASWPQAAAMMIYAAVIFLFAALPSTARDELIYHLEIPKRLLAARGFFFFQDNIYAYFPQLAEMLMMFCLTVQGELLAKLIHPLYGMLLFAVLYGFSRRCLSRGFSFFAVLILASVPSVAATMAIAYVDLAFAVYALLALLALFQYFETRKLGWAAVAGMMSAGTLCIKYTGLHFTAILAVLAAAEHLQSRRPSFLKALLLLTAIPVLIASPYFIRNILMTGWPLFPFPTAGLR